MWNRQCLESWGSFEKNILALIFVKKNILAFTQTKKNNLTLGMRKKNYCPPEEQQNIMFMYACVYSKKKPTFLIHTNGAKKFIWSYTLKKIFQPSIVIKKNILSLKTCKKNISAWPKNPPPPSPGSQMVAPLWSFHSFPKRTFL